MNRRRYLAAVAASSLAGCPARGGWSETQISSGTPTPVVPDGVQRLVHLDAVDDVPTDGVTIDATVREPTMTAEHPPRAAVTTSNEGRERDVTANEGMCCLFNRGGGASEPAGAWLHRPEASKHVERDGDRWSRDAPADENRAYAAYGCLPRTFASGESITNEYHVWDDYRAEGYLPTGTYRFEERVTVAEPDGDLQEASDVIAAFDWGFSVQVERP
jgi:hypothetical protein